MVELESVECNPSVRFLDLIKDYQLNISIEELERHYKAAIVNKDLQLFPAPFGLRSKVSITCNLPMVMTKDGDGNNVSLKHMVFPTKCKSSVVCRAAACLWYPSQANFMHMPTMGERFRNRILPGEHGLLAVPLL